jgi:hypothetical protein
VKLLRLDEGTRHLVGWMAAGGVIGRRGDIGAALGASMETASRLMAEFRRRGLLRVAGRRLVCDRTGLGALAGLTTGGFAAGVKLFFALSRTFLRIQRAPLTEINAHRRRRRTVLFDAQRGRGRLFGCCGKEGFKCVT